MNKCNLLKLNNRIDLWQALAANLFGVLMRPASVVVHPDVFKNNEQGPTSFAFEPLLIVLEIYVARHVAWYCRPISLLNPLLHCWNTGAIILPLFVWTHQWSSIKTKPSVSGSPESSEAS
jgi:hypothetical protein